MITKETGFAFSRSNRAPLSSRTLAVLALSLAAALAGFGSCGCSAYTTANTQSSYTILSPSPTTINFGNVSVGSSATQTVTLTNGGTASITVSQTKISSSAFTIAQGAALSSIAAGKSATLQIRFAPSSSGAVSGSLTITSNAQNSPTTVALSGTGVTTAAPQLTASPSSVTFGNVSVGGSSSLGVTLANNGNANLTFSAVTVSGAGFSASGVGATTTLGPGNSTLLTVTFAPAATGGTTASVSIASDASNSPSMISLSGAGVTPGTPAPGAPACGISGDISNHVPTDWQAFTPPPKGLSYVDPTFGCTVTRITDASRDVWTGSFYLPLNMGYSTVSPFNTNDTLLMLVDGFQRYFVTDLTGNIVVPHANMPAMGDTWVMWNASDPSVFYYTQGNSMMKGAISGSTASGALVHQFTEYSAINFMAETDVSQDGAHVVIIGGDTSGSSPENIFDYDFVTNTKGPVYTTSCVGSVGVLENNCLHKLIQTPDNNVIVQFASDGAGPEQGNRLWSGLTPLPQLQDSTDHLDTGYDLNGNAVFVEVGNAQYLPTLPGITNPCPSGYGLDVRQINNPLLAVCLLDHPPSWHVGYRGNAQQPWVGLSFFDVRSPSPEWFDNNGSFSAPTSSNWLLYEDEIIVVRIDANNNSSFVYRLARAYSRSDEDFYAQPHAAISRDGRYLAFNSDMAYAHSGCPANFQTPTSCTDVYIVKVK